MKNKNLVIIMLFVSFFIIGIAYFKLNQKITAFASLSEEKCSNLGDDCWHSLAHQAFNREFCYNITNIIIRKHCLEHIPEMNKENKEKW